MNHNLKDIYQRLDDWIIENDYKSYDLCDVKGTNLFLKSNALNTSKFKIGNFVAFPVNYLLRNHSPILRKALNIEKNKYPQAQALIANSYLNLYRKNSDKTYLDKAKLLLDWIISNKTSGFENYCWGQPYDWYSRKVIEKHTPRTTVSSQVAAVFIDMFELTGEQKYLDITKSICDFYINDLNWNEDQDGDICFSYTTVDNYHIHNANMLAAAILIRTWKHTQISEYKDFGVKAINFTLKHQNEDGSWFYWAPPDRVIGKIDHYHTGFVLESLYEILNIVDSDDIEKSFLKGLQYYDNNLFTSDLVPKYTNEKLYPIDIQSLAQSIITYAVVSGKFHEYNDKALKIMTWTVENMYDSDGYFYYRIYKNGNIDKTPYIRWAESWMLRALSLII